MCGRYTIKAAPETLRQALRLRSAPKGPARYNVAPNQDVPVVRTGLPFRETIFMRWGLVHPWCQNPDERPPLINVHAPMLTASTAFRGAFERRRCLVVADGFYGWSGENRQMWYTTLLSGAPFGFAGIWERWKPTDERGAPFLSTAIVTAACGDGTAPFYDAMPVILADSAAQDAWLGFGTPLHQLKELLMPPQPGSILSHRVGDMVRSVRNNGPGCIEPVD